MATVCKYATLLLFVFWALCAQRLKTDDEIHAFLIVATYAAVLGYSLERAWRRKRTATTRCDEARHEVTSPARTTVLAAYRWYRRDDYSTALLPTYQGARHALDPRGNRHTWKAVDAMHSAPDYEDKHQIHG